MTHRGSERLDHLVHGVVTECLCSRRHSKGDTEGEHPCAVLEGGQKLGVHMVWVKAQQPEARLEAEVCVCQGCVCVRADAGPGEAFWLQRPRRLWGLNTCLGGLSPGICDPGQPRWIPEAEALDRRGQLGGG